MFTHNYFDEITNLTGIIWQNYRMIDKMPIIVSLVNNSNILPTTDGLNRYAFACQHLTDFDKCDRQFVVENLRQDESFILQILPSDDIYYDWKYSKNATDNEINYYLLNFSQNSKCLILQDIIIYFEANDTDGFTQFNYKVYPDLPNEFLWVQTDLTGSILNSVWENPYA